MAYDGEVSERHWCSFHACMRSYCDWQHRETFEQLRERVRLTTMARGGIVVPKTTETGDRDA